MTKDAPDSSVESLYKPTSWLAKIDFINQIALGTNIMVSVIGEPASGKTSFATLLQQQLDSKIESIYIAANNLFDETSFVGHVSSLFGVEKAHSLNQLVDAIENRKSPSLLIIDDAQHLPTMFVESLLKELKAIGPECVFHVCLIANKSILKSLSNLDNGPYKELIHTVELGHLNEKETKEYVMHRLISMPDFISSDRSKQFFDYTDGSIIGINTQMSSFFNLEKIATGGQRAKQQSKNIKWLAMVASAVIIALGLAFTLQPSKSGLTPKSDLLVEIDSPLPITSVQDIGEEQVFLSSIPPYDLAAVKQFMQATDLRRAEIILLREEDDAMDESMVVMDKVVVIPKTIKPVKHHAQKTITKVKKPIAKPKTYVSKPVVSKSKGYTIQLIASQDRAKLERFASEHNIAKKVTIRKSTKNNKGWYVLTVGEYSDANGARQAISYLPVALQKNKPWIRQIEKLQTIG
jgi:DamX protein